MAMIETVRQRQKNSVDFASCYDNLCALQNSCPLGSITANLDELTIDCNADRIRHSDWTPILNALKINKTLKTVAFRSYWQQTLYPDGGTKTLLNHSLYLTLFIATRSVDFNFRTELPGFGGGVGSGWEQGVLPLLGSTPGVTNAGHAKDFCYGF